MDRNLLANQWLIDFCDFLTEPSCEPERLAIAQLIRESAKGKAANPKTAGSQFSAQTDKPYTTAQKYREVFRANHSELIKLFGDRRIHLAVIRDWWQSTQELLPGDFEKPTSKSQDLRWWSLIGNSLRNSDVFVSSGERYYYYIRPIPNS
jgi:hypothetical protein